MGKISQISKQEVVAEAVYARHLRSQLLHPSSSFKYGEWAFASGFGVKATVAVVFPEPDGCGVEADFGAYQLVELAVYSVLTVVGHLKYIASEL